MTRRNKIQNKRNKIKMKGKYIKHLLSTSLFLKLLIKPCFQINEKVNFLL